MGIPLKNRKGKVEKPRPLKICTLGDQSSKYALQKQVGYCTCSKYVRSISGDTGVNFLQ